MITLTACWSHFDHKFWSQSVIKLITLCDQVDHTLWSSWSQSVINLVILCDQNLWSSHVIASRDFTIHACHVVGHVTAQKSLSVTGESRFRDLPVNVPHLQILTDLQQLAIKPNKPIHPYIRHHHGAPLLQPIYNTTHPFLLFELADSLHGWLTWLTRHTPFESDLNPFEFQWKINYHNRQIACHKNSIYSFATKQ